METIRRGCFETNSSSTHSLSFNRDTSSYLSKSKTLVVDFINTDDETVFNTLKGKVSYLVSQIINNYQYDVFDYEDLKEQVENDRDFIRIRNYVKEHFDKDVVLPKNHPVKTFTDEDGETYTDISDLVNINHQIRFKFLNDCLQDIVGEQDLLGIVLSPENNIEIGRD